MNISGTLHFYSGEDKELFFVFDDDLAQQLYSQPEFDLDDLDTRRAYISVGVDRFIHRRTLSFSRKQTEIKVSLCSKGAKDNLASLTTLYRWFAARGRPRPTPFPVIGTFKKVRHEGKTVRELWITEPADLVAPPGLRRRQRTPSRERRSYEHRRRFLPRDLAEAGRPAEQLAFTLAEAEFPAPGYVCFWRREFLDSERIEIRRMGVVADIDVWNAAREAPEAFIEVKAQKVRRPNVDPAFYVSVGEWRSFRSAVKARVPYQVWLFQYTHLRDFKRAPRRVELIVFDDLDPDWMEPGGYLVTPELGCGTRFRLRGGRNARRQERAALGR